VDVSAAFAAGGLYSTVRDMARLDRALDTDTLLAAETIQQAFTPARLNDGGQGTFGLGWMIRTYRGLREVSHGGDVDGFNSCILRFPDQQLTVVVLSNLGMWPPGGPIPSAADLAHRIADIYLSDVMGPPEQPVAIDLDPAIYDDYVGRYRASGPAEVLAAMGDTITISREGDRLYGRTEMGTAELCPMSETTFFSKDQPDIRATFVRGDEGTVIGLTIDMMGARTLAAEKLPPE
jgi:hypothetical protein